MTLRHQWNISWSHFIKSRDKLDRAIKSKIGDCLETHDPSVDGISTVIPDKIFRDYEDNFDLDPLDDEFDRKETEDYSTKETDTFLNFNVALPSGDTFIKWWVARRKLAPDGTPLGLADRNPILDTREYQVNLIKENLYSQVDKEGYKNLFLNSILEHKKDGKAVAKDDQYSRSYNKNMVRQITTKGWELLVQWKNSSTSWEPLRNLKESYPIEVAECAIANKIAEEAAFSWWVKNTLRNRERILAKLKSRYWSRTHKYGVYVPNRAGSLHNWSRYGNWILDQGYW
jgi:hypothetical protein